MDVVRAGRGYETVSGIPIEADPASLVKVADSLKEYRRWMDLTRLQAVGMISGLRKQVPFVLHGVNGAKLCRYVADFVYVERGQRVVEDTKGVLTAMYKLKKKMLADEYGVAIRES